MKMKVSTRIIFTIYIIVVILLCAFLLLTMYRVFPAENLILSVKTMIEGDIGFIILYTVIFAAMIVLGFMLIFFGIRKKKEKIATISTFENGKILISENALAQLSKNYFSQFDYIEEKKFNINIKNNMLDLIIDIQVNAGINIPDVSEQIQTGLPEYIFSNTGIKVNDAKVLVTTITETQNNQI